MPRALQLPDPVRQLISDCWTGEHGRPIMTGVEIQRALFIELGYPLRLGAIYRIADRLLLPSRYETNALPSPDRRRVVRRRPRPPVPSLERRQLAERRRVEIRCGNCRGRYLILPEQLESGGATCPHCGTLRLPHGHFLPPH